MDVREKLVGLSDIQVLQREIECVKRKSATNCTDCLNCDLLMTDDRILSAYANAIAALQNANGVTVQEWVSADKRMPTQEDAPTEYVFTAYKNQNCYDVGIALLDTVVAYPDLYDYWMALPLPEPPKGE